MIGKKVSSSAISPDFLFEAQTGFYKYLAVKAALDSRMFDNLSEPTSAFDVAEAVGGDRDVVDRLLQALWAMGLVERHADGFVNSPAARKFCVRSSPDCLAGVFDFTHACLAGYIRNRRVGFVPGKTTACGTNPLSFGACGPGSGSHVSGPRMIPRGSLPPCPCLRRPGQCLIWDAGRAR